VIDYLEISLLVVFLIALALPTLRDLAVILRRADAPHPAQTLTLAGNSEGSAKR
jgi:hypothetical protein